MSGRQESSTRISLASLTPIGAQIRLMQLCRSLEGLVQPFSATGWGNAPAGKPELSLLQAQVQLSLDVVAAILKKWPKHLPPSVVEGLLDLRHHATRFPHLIKPEYWIKGFHEPKQGDFRATVKDLLYKFGLDLNDKVGAWAQASRKATEDRIHG